MSYITYKKVAHQGRLTFPYLFTNENKRLSLLENSCGEEFTVKTPKICNCINRAAMGSKALKCRSKS